MPVVAEHLWLTDYHGAVRVEFPDQSFLVVENEWAAVAGDPQPTTAQRFVAVTFETSATPGEWAVAFLEAARQEAYVGNVHSDPNAIVLVEGGPHGPKPIWPDGPGFVTTDWKGEIRVMSPTHASVRCCGSEV